MFGAPMRRFSAGLAAAVAVGVLGAGFLFFDGCGKIERSVRAILGTWDMWDSQSTSAYEEPFQPIPAEGSQAVVAGLPEQESSLEAHEDSFASAGIHVHAMGLEERKKRAALAYRRYCHHCHGINGDGRSIVGESYAFVLPDLRSWDIQKKLDQEIYDFITQGGKRMIPLAHTTTGLERLLAILHLDVLKDRPSVPLFPEKWVNPAEQPGGP